MKGAKIYDPYVIIEMAKSGGSVFISIYPKGRQRVPASFAQNFQFHYLMKLILKGKVFFYKNKKSKKHD